MQHLDRDGGIIFQSSRGIHRSHAATSDLAQQFVITKRSWQSVRRLGSTRPSGIGGRGSEHRSRDLSEGGMILQELTQLVSDVGVPRKELWQR